jgi:hypothetical protein
MQHGRDHEERELKVKHRSNATPDEASLDKDEMVSTGELAENEPLVDGAEVAPTKRAEERERVRHREERKRGRMAAGIGENLRDRREPGVTREVLDEAARAADEQVKGK